jgi:hypothetical protein
MFLPWGKCFSLDSARRNTPVPKGAFFGMASIAYTLQIFLFYFFSGMLKTGAAWRIDGSAIYDTLQIDQLVTHFGHTLLAFPSLLIWLTFATVFIETWGALALLCPWYNGQIRTAALLLFACLQLGINSSLHLGLFGIISIVVTLGLLPPWFWEKCITPLRKRIYGLQEQENLRTPAQACFYLCAVGRIGRLCRTYKY